MTRPGKTRVAALALPEGRPLRPRGSRVSAPHRDGALGWGSNTPDSAKPPTCGTAQPPGLMRIPPPRRRIGRSVRYCDARVFPWARKPPAPAVTGLNILGCSRRGDTGKPRTIVAADGERHDALVLIGAHRSAARTVPLATCVTVTNSHLQVRWHAVPRRQTPPAELTRTRNCGPRPISCSDRCPARATKASDHHATKQVSTAPALANHQQFTDRRLGQEPDTLGA